MTLAMTMQAPPHNISIPEEAIQIKNEEVYSPTCNRVHAFPNLEMTTTNKEDLISQVIGMYNLILSWSAPARRIKKAIWGAPRSSIFPGSKCAQWQQLPTKLLTTDTLSSEYSPAKSYALYPSAVSTTRYVKARSAKSTITKKPSAHVRVGKSPSLFYRHSSILAIIKVSNFPTFW